MDEMEIDKQALMEILKNLNKGVVEKDIKPRKGSIVVVEAGNSDEEGPELPDMEGGMPCMGNGHGMGEGPDMEKIEQLKELVKSIFSK